jgi:predicted lipoprotein with Yx(FWY)xxD motif
MKQISYYLLLLLIGCSYTQTPSGGATGGVQSTQSVTVTTADTSLGKILVDSDGMTLYTFNNDRPGVSNCAGSCATLWPPLTTSGLPTGSSDVTGTLSTITRPDGSMQVTYNDMPVYTFTLDKNPGDTTGEGYNNLWYVVKV